MELIAYKQLDQHTTSDYLYKSHPSRCIMTEMNETNLAEDWKGYEIMKGA